MLKMLFAVAMCAVSWAQAPTVLRFANLPPEAFSETATVIRSVGEIHNMRVDPESRSITFAGTAWQIGLAGWLFAKLDRPVTDQRPSIERYDMTGVVDPVVRVFSPARAISAQALQELTTAIRSAVEIRRGFVFNPANVAVMRGTPDEIAAAEWLFNELDRRPDARAASDVWRMPNSEEGTIRVFYLNPALSDQELVQQVSHIRAEVKIRRMFLPLSYRAAVVRGAPDQIAMAERLISERKLSAGIDVDPVKSGLASLASSNRGLALLRNHARAGAH